MVDAKVDYLSTNGLPKDLPNHVYKDAHFPAIGSLVFAINLVYQSNL